MNLGVRGKLFAISVALIGTAVLAAGLYLEPNLRRLNQQRIESDLMARTALVREAVRGIGPDAAVTAFDEAADRLAGAARGRVTIIDADGRVVGDSGVPADELRDVENHARRPEVVDAITEGRGVARRDSATVNQSLLYAALPFEQRGRAWVVRVALPLEETDAVTQRLRAMLFAAALLGLLAAVFLSGLASHLMSRTLRTLVAHARRLSLETIDNDEAVGLSGRSDEIAGIAGSLNRLAEEFERTVDELATERDRFKAVIESMAEGVIALDRERRVVLMNAAARELIDSPDVVDPEDEESQPRLAELLRSPELDDLVTETLAGRRTSAEISTARERRRVLAIHGTPTRSGPGAVLVLHDITELRRLERIRQDFVANVSHELRTPVSVIRANAELVLDVASDDPESAREFLVAIQKNAERLTRLIADLLDIARMESGRFRLAHDELNLSACADRALDSVATAAAERGHELRLEIDDALFVRADERALEQILTNLVVNAIKYTPRDGEICVRAIDQGKRVRVEVIDDGPGIAPEHRPRIFERFYRVDTGRSRAEGGTGLGLAIVKHLVGAMRGEVGVEPNDPRGSIFWFALPKPEEPPRPLENGRTDALRL